MKIRSQHIRILLVFLLVSNCAMQLYGQDYRLIDSLKTELSKSKDEERKVDLLNKIAQLYSHYDHDTTNVFLDQAISLADQIDYKKGLSQAYLIGGRILLSQGNKDSAKTLYDHVLKIQENHPDSVMLMRTYLSLGTYYDVISEYPQAIESYLKAAEISAEREDSTLLASAYLGLGNVNQTSGNDSVALKYYRKAQKIYLKINPLYASWTANNMGIIYVKKKELDKAEQLYKLSIRIKKKYHDNFGIAFTYGNLGDVYLNRGDYEAALGNYRKSLDYKLKIDASKETLANSYQKFAETYSKMGHYQKAERYYDTTLVITGNNGLKKLETTTLGSLARHYARKGDYKSAYFNHTRYMEHKDSIFNQQRQNKIAEMQEKYESEKKQLKIKSLKNEKKLKEQELKREQAERKKETTQKVAFAGGFGLMLILAFVIWRGLQRKKKDNAIISEQKVKVEEKNREITDSINYAKRIQGALLPSGQQMRSMLKDDNYFLFYRPKDIVAGDFYWMEEFNDRVLFAVADCTGHGVPGALVSVVCNNALTRATGEYGLFRPAEILDKVNQLVEEQFEKSSEEVKDGMDISLCSLNTNTMKLEYAGANNPLWIVSKDNEEMKIIKADKQPIGKYHHKKPFTNHSMQVKKGDMIYLFSDGFPDQFGGPKGKKYKYKPFKRLLLPLSRQPVSRQKEEIQKEFDKWKGNLDQIDDVCVLGVRV